MASLAASRKVLFKCPEMSSFSMTNFNKSYKPDILETAHFRTPIDRGYFIANRITPYIIKNPATIMNCKS